MHICLAGDNGIHFQRWISSLYEKGDYKISVISLHRGKEISGVEYYYLPRIHNTKLDYFLNIKLFRKLISKLNPDILHCHYASGYGMLGALSGFHPFVLSVWGDDVISFPNNILTKYLTRYILKKADVILATSNYLGGITKNYTTKKIEIINFGIDTNIFKPSPVDHSEINIGTIKSLNPQYGIDTLINAFKLLENEPYFNKLKLIIVGSGVLEDRLKDLVSQLYLDEKVTFTGKIEHDRVPYYHNLLDIFVALSISESFGVAILEAQACSKPVVVSDVGGLPEVMKNNITGFIVPSSNANAAAEAIKKLIEDKELRIKMGDEGRKFVIENFEWKKNVSEMCEIYKRFEK